MILKGNSTSQKLRGAYYTPRALADAMVSRLCDGGHHDVLEPSCGDGVFVEALSKAGSMAEGAELTVVDNDPYAVREVRSKFGGNPSIRIIEQDFFACRSSLGEASFDLVIGNPPYIRYQYMTPAQRETLSDLLASQGMKANRLVNAWVGFMVACTTALRDGGQVLFVIPAEILQVAYAEDLRLFLATHYCEITLVTFEKLVFDGIEQEVIVFAGRKGSQPGRMRVVMARDVCDFAEMDLSSVRFQPLGRVHEKWTRYFVSAEDASAISRAREDGRFARLGDLALVNVGVTTGNNRFFSLDESTADAYDLVGHTLPLVGRSSHACGAYFTSEDWLRNRRAGKLARLLALKDGEYEGLTERSRAYIDEGKARGEDAGYKCSIRDSWYAVPSVWVPDAFFLRRSNLFPKLVLNACGAVSTDTMHRVKFHPDINPELVLLGYYSSIGLACAELCGRSYGGGVLEILPGEASAMLIPDLRLASLAEEDVASYVALVDDALRSDRRIEGLLDVIDSEVLVGRMGIDAEVCAAFRRAWATLQRRRLGRSADS